MPRRYTYEEIKSFIDSNSGGKCKLLSTEYINDKTPLLLQCECGNTFTRTFKKLRLNRFTCIECTRKKAHDLFAFTYEQVKQKVKEKGCTLISENYYNGKQKLLIRCKCGTIFKRSFLKFNSGQINCQKCANKKTAQAKIKYTQAYVEKKIAEKGYTLIGKYVDAQTPVKCKCSRGHIFDLKFSSYLNKRNGCKQCANINSRGANHYNYKGGESELIDFLRKSIKEWKKQVARKYNYKCYISGEKRGTVIHHIKSFNTIVKETLSELNLELYRKLKDYTPEQIEQLKELILSKHTVDNGILIKRAIHNDFHSQYGKGDNTLEQFNEFLEKNYPHIKSL